MTGPAQSVVSVKTSLRRLTRRLVLIIALLAFYISGDALATREASANRLKREKSPYLLQHADNPVDWYPWGDEAFKRAKKEDKPIFLSIGYSTCHWCHVMEEESFEDREIAKLLNRDFISIKVDREERTDIDHVYMKVVMSLTGSGGWPLTVFLTPDKKPFYGGTYFPPEDRFGTPGLKNVLNFISGSWKTRRGEIETSSESIAQAIEKYTSSMGKDPVALDAGIFKNAREGFALNFDRTYGGFSSAPKFPSGHSLSFLMRDYKRSDAGYVKEMVEKTLLSMARGGVYDQIGGGFHRYSTDERWFLPHFEKMLYDQAVLSKTYVEAYQLTKNEEYKRIAEEIFKYVIRDMEDKDGGFYSAEDADSPLDRRRKVKREGAFYVWSKSEIIDLLGGERGEIVSYYFGVAENGNVASDPRGEFTGKNVLYRAHTLEETAAKFKKDAGEIEKILEESKEILFSKRSGRPRPHLDDKILTNWNGLMISSLALASRVFGNEEYMLSAERAARFIMAKLIDKKGRLLHRYRKRDAAIQGTIEDYSFFIHGLIDLYEATFNIKYLIEAKRLTDAMVELFWDEEVGGFFFVADDAKEILVRSKEIYDGAVPSGNAIAALDLLRIGAITADPSYTDLAAKLFKTFSSNVQDSPTDYTGFLAAFDYAQGPSKEVVLVGDASSDETKDIIGRIYSHFAPNKVVVFKPAPDEDAEPLIKIAPFLKDYSIFNNKTTAYICENNTCSTPTTDIATIEQSLTK